ncbi:hypothetical protein AKJ09_01342 [Labilithrix luteola]|uniref:Flagellar hook-basal body complex protein FliE n=1 Tax=Labilithrix luteola TaxID=1391654 RepID=A0A0K1PMB2_9BACT|nr:flagellar hook-basal body complex protein FliE [Labilithrix luteola]AKU94678.1 hypothetical protein AKJ09_01342 [Labilithrix luteola]
MRIEGSPELSIGIPSIDGGTTSPAEGTPASGGLDFGTLLEKTVEDTNQLQKDATAKAEALAKGASDDLHGTMISVKEAEISLKLVGSIRNRLIDAFHELWRINL